ncbi:MAG TPA: sigma-70 family RNA polymerase sigma factor [Isosphaeraceae bacterium]|nr:sigma-70 family RNA polymerase sigma factor [Isosphaeraceae bacterium]
MFRSTVAENFESWDRFLRAYYTPIRAALGLLPFVGEERADDVAQSFFLKMYERDFLANRPALEGRFRNWLYVAARHHALDEYRKIRRRPERADAFEVEEPADPHPNDPDDLPFDADEFYALSVLHLTVSRVRKHLLEEGKSEHWMIFEELVLAPLIPGRSPKTRDQLLAMFPGQGPVFLDNRMTTVKRVFRRILPALIPADPTENLTPEQRFQELLEILRDSKNNRLWLAFLLDPTPGVETSPGSSLDLAAGSTGSDRPEAPVTPEILQDELRILLGFWLEMPLAEYLEDLESVGPAVAAVIRGSWPSSSLTRKPRAAALPLNLRGLVDGSRPPLSSLPPEELKLVFERLKTFAKRVHRAAKRAGAGAGAETDARGGARRENSLPFEIAQVLYNLAGALALTRCDSRIIGLGDGQFRKNLAWVLSQPWLDARLRPIFFAAFTQIGPAGSV